MRDGIFLKMLMINTNGIHLDKRSDMEIFPGKECLSGANQIYELLKVSQATVNQS